VTVERIRDLNRFYFPHYQFANEKMAKQIAKAGKEFEPDLAIFRSERAHTMEQVGKRSEEHGALESALKRIDVMHGFEIKQRPF
jgi:hypothetical protein